MAPYICPDCSRPVERTQKGADEHNEKCPLRIEFDPQGTAFVKREGWQGNDVDWVEKAVRDQTDMPPLAPVPGEKPVNIPSFSIADEDTAARSPLKFIMNLYTQMSPEDQEELMQWMETYTVRSCETCKSSFNQPGLYPMVCKHRDLSRPTVSVIDGEHVNALNLKECAWLRSKEDWCGAEGKFWEEKND